MTSKEFEQYLNDLTDLTDYQYACETWDSMTDIEKERCTPKMMDGYIADTYVAVSEMEE
jgi:hypothetical protein